MITRWQPPHSFIDVQMRGPYPLWEHTHPFTAIAGGTEIHDLVRYRIPLGPLARRRPLVRRWLDSIFDYRAERTAELLS